MTDDLPFDYDESSPTPTGARPKPHRHRWVPYPYLATNVPLSDRILPTEWCDSCHRWRDPVSSRKGRSSLRAGKDAERAIDLSRDAFARLAPPSRGLVEVTVEW